MPESGACDFCLMLASRGAACTRESLGRSKKFHDNCRCLGIEVKDPEDLPRVNRELGELWEATGSEPAFFGALQVRSEGVARWLPSDSVRIDAEPRRQRGRHSSVKTAAELRTKGLVDHPDTWKSRNRGKRDKQIWGREQKNWALRVLECVADRRARFGVAQHVGVLAGTR